MRSISFLIVGALSASAWSQTSVTMAAATAKGTRGTSEVRIRWQIAEGWIPAGGFKLYRVVGRDRQLVRAIEAPTDERIDSLLEPRFRGRKLVSLAAGPAPGRIDFDNPRPPSSLPDFNRVREAHDRLRTFPSPILPPTQRAERIRLLEQTRLPVPSAGRPGAPTRPGLEGGVPSSGTVGALSTGGRAPTTGQNPRLALDARHQLHLAAMLDDRNAATIGLGATDRDVSPATRGYALHGVSASGQESPTPLATIGTFTVGSDPEPAAPTGVVAFQNEDTVCLRWDRPSVADEKRLLNASYRVYQAASAAGPFRLLHQKPMVILALPGNKEPVWFFSTKLKEPGTHVYRVSLVDGFDRESAPASLTLTAADWRRPDPPRRAAASLGSAFISTVKGKALATRVRRGMTPSRIDPTVAWIPGRAVHELPLKYHVWRTDLDVISAAPTRITSAPVDGTALPVGTDAQVEAALDLILGPHAEEAHEANIATIRTAPPPPGRSAADHTRAVAIAVAKAEAAHRARIAALKALIKTSPVRTFADATAQKDRRYFYQVTAVYAPVGLESAPTLAGQLDVPDLAAPPAVAGLSRKSFKILSAPRLTLVKAPLKPTTPRVTAGSVLKGRRQQPRFGVPEGLRGVSRPELKLALYQPDRGGEVELAWTPLPLKDVRYQIWRKVADSSPRSFTRRSKAPAPNPGDGFVEVGLTAPNVSTFADRVPRTRSRTYIYRVAALTRWDVIGPVASLTVNVPTMLAPDRPNLLSASPEGSGGVKLLVERPAASQEVHNLLLMRNGTQVKTVQVPTGTADIEIVDTGLSLGTVYTYTVVAQTAGMPQVAGTQLSSQPSTPLKSSPVKLTVGKPANLALSAAATGVVLTWSAPAEAGVTYIVRRRPAANAPAVVIAPKVTGTTFTDIYALSGKTYFYEVLAVDAAGNLSAVEAKSITVP